MSPSERMGRAFLILCVVFERNSVVLENAESISCGAAMLCGRIGFLYRETTPCRSRTRQLPDPRLLNTSRNVFLLPVVPGIARPKIGDYSLATSNTRQGAPLVYTRESVRVFFPQNELFFVRFFSTILYAEGVSPAEFNLEVIPGIYH